MPEMLETTERSAQVGKVAIRFKACPRCQGDLLLTLDMFLGTKYFNCLQCGYNLDVTEVRPAYLVSSSAMARNQRKGRRKAA